MIYLLSLARMLDIDLEAELTRKIEKNTHRIYEQKDGVNIRILIAQSSNSVIISNKETYLRSLYLCF